MSCLARERDPRHKGTDAFAARYENLPIGAEYRSVDGPHEGLSVRVFTCLYREGGRGIVREPEGIERGWRHSVSLWLNVPAVRI
jgi:hypothetical protein